MEACPGPARPQQRQSFGQTEYSDERMAASADPVTPEAANTTSHPQPQVLVANTTCHPQQLQPLSTHFPRPPTLPLEL